MRYKVAGGFGGRELTDEEAFPPWQAEGFPSVPGAPDGTYGWGGHGE